MTTPRALLASLPALLIGAVGGAIFLYLRMPLAWMLGSMFLVAVVALAGGGKRLPLTVHARLRELMVAVIGVMLGSAFKPDMIDRAGEWLDLIILMLVYVPLTTTLCYWVFRKLGKLDPVTSYFSATPGGLQEMTMLGEHYGGDARSIIMTHAIRVFMVVMTVPVYFRFVENLNVPPMAPGVHLADMPLKEGLLLLGCGIIGWLVADKLRIPAARLVGPMLVSGAVHLAGFSSAQPPPELVAVAQVAMGAALGVRFVNTPLREVGRIARLAVAATALMLAVSVLMTIGFSRLNGLASEAVMLVLSPGGLAEMSLVALALGVEVAIVSSMHVFRIAVVVIAAPLAFRLLGLKRKT
ncbi:AbrB family transcriptional regulator [Ferrovibrio sp.]|uniref:AbrB family transcriptional regulator n=1 Tax=Ferrovibrio sp. TaxID=1917215 RepID=UPI00261ABC13|nr:AbrB family transcriptional regulator [Ferrovibrio sp.]